MMRTFKAENGNTLVALDDTQADAMISGGMTEVFEDDNIAFIDAVIGINEGMTEEKLGIIPDKSQKPNTKKVGGDNDETN